MELPGFLLFWIGLIVAIGLWASKWNRSVAGWVAFAFFLSPLLAGIFLAIAGRIEHLPDGRFPRFT